MNKLRCLALALAFAWPAVVPAQDKAPSQLYTPEGWEIGGQLSYYDYEEPGIMKLSGNRGGVVANLTFANAQRVFGRLEMRISHGLLYYESQNTGTQDDVPDWLAEIRLVAGWDFAVGQSMVMSPYAGIGYRHLYNDLRGTSSTGAAGYRRYSEYAYLPIGITARIDIGRGWVMAPNLEWDVFLEGKQESKLPDSGIPGFTEANNTQNSARGYRASLMFENGRWVFGPYANYWKVKASDIVPIGNGVMGQEPENKTRETGVEVRYRF